MPAQKRAAGDINSGTTQKKPRVSEVKVLTVPSGARNVELSELFKKLSKLHQTCPLLPVDQWKSYCFSVTSGRLRNLSFEVTNDPRVLQRLKSIRGFGTGTMDKIDEFLETGDISRIMEFETDPKRIAMKKMMDIWGVGRVKAMELVLAGYRDIGQVRAKIVEHKLTLDRNQLVGVECYEDILEEMGRDEVEAIGRIVEQTVQQIYPGADLEIMGSYRRGNKGCGDVDVHITHHKFRKKVPEEALGKVADELWRKGHIAFHLTFLPGMQTGRLPHDFHASSRFVPAAAWEASKQASCKWKGTSNGFSSATYFGVFRSPVFKEKRRRVDIKLYPHRETPFASLYFTGNGYFNRSMRLWASRMSYILNDHGLFQRGTNKRVMEASSEKEVFEKLELEYKAPEERDCFDAVVPLKNTPRAELQMKESDFYKDNEHVWIN